MATAKVRRPTRKGCPNRAIDFKRQLAAAACEPGISVAKLALEHGVNTNLLFKWRREFRAGKYGVVDPVHQARSGPNLPATVPQSEPAMTLLPVQVSPPESTASSTAAPCIEIVFRTATVRIYGAPELVPLRTVLDCLARRS